MERKILPYKKALDYGLKILDSQETTDLIVYFTESGLYGIEPDEATEQIVELERFSVKLTFFGWVDTLVNSIDEPKDAGAFIIGCYDCLAGCYKHDLNDVIADNTIDEDDKHKMVRMTVRYYAIFAKMLPKIIVAYGLYNHNIYEFQITKPTEEEYES